MKDFDQILLRAQKPVKRFEELEQLIAAPEIIADSRYWLRLAAEHCTLAPVAAAYHSLTNPQIDEAQAGQAAERLSAALTAAISYSDEIAAMEISAAGNPSAGGLLFCAYKNFALKNGLDFAAITQDEKNARYCAQISGAGAYSLLREENGVHLFDRDKVTVIIYPFINTGYKINPDDIRIDLFHSGGAGGQNVNKVESAVRATHLPSGIAAVCQDERSQLKNKERVLNTINKRVSEFYNKQAEDKNAAAKKEAQRLCATTARSYDLKGESCKNFSATLSVRINKSQIEIY